MNKAPAESKLKVLSDEDYVRQRLKPSPFDKDYLHLADLAALIGEVAPKVRGVVFDYGSGGAPYASLFSQCSAYVAADLEAGPKVNRLLRPDGLTDEPGASYDFILSTQVLEHVRDPGVYLGECLRLLRPGGQILLTTHGLFEEHGCPHDYHRWTARGLEDLFAQSGFKVIRSGKLTTEIRAVVQLTTYLAHHLRCADNRLLHILLAVVRKTYLKILMPFLNRFADLFPEQAMAGAQAPDSIYVAIFVQAQKP